MNFGSYENLLDIFKGMKSSITARLARKENVMTPGTNVTIADDGTISAVDTTYGAGQGMSLSDGNFTKDKHFAEYERWTGADNHCEVRQQNSFDKSSPVYCTCRTTYPIQSTQELDQLANPTVCVVELGDNLNHLTYGIFAVDNNFTEDTCHFAFNIEFEMQGKTYIYNNALKCGAGQNYLSFSSMLPLSASYKNDGDVTYMCIRFPSFI